MNTENSKWALWLDDLRNPHTSPKRNLHPLGLKYIWARDVEQAQYFVVCLGIPEYMALDHDLGVNTEKTIESNIVTYTETGMQFLIWLESFMRTETQGEALCSPPKWKIHSDNPEGSKNMESFLRSWARAATLVEHEEDEGLLVFSNPRGVF